CRVPCLWLSYQPSSRSACSPAPSRRSSGSAIKASYTLFKTVPTSAGTHQMGVHSAVGGFTRRGHGASTTRLRPVHGPSTARPRAVYGSTTARTRFSRGTVSTSGVQLARPGHGASMRHAFRAAPGESLMVLFGSVESMMIDDGVLRWSRSIHRIPTQWPVLIGRRVSGIGSCAGNDVGCAEGTSGGSPSASCRCM
ncbi:hypothetical protein BMONG18_1677, partial [Bifidobacterium mongoliense]